MRLLLFSDVHTDLEACEQLVEASKSVDVVVGAGDFASAHEGLEETIRALGRIERPAVIVPGNNERHEAIREVAAACWPGALLLHGSGATVDGRSFYGLGCGVPPIGKDWSFDLEEDEAAGLLAAMPSGAVLVTHSPPRGHADEGRGSTAVLEAIRAKRPPLVVCGHVHERWREVSWEGTTAVVNAGPAGVVAELDGSGVHINGIDESSESD